MVFSLKVDLHTHTSVSDGSNIAYEMIQEASCRGLKILGITDHGPAHGTDIRYFRDIDPYLNFNGMSVYFGCEASVMTLHGDLDLPETYQKNMGVLLAGLHRTGFKDKTKENNTKAIVNAMKNPHVSIISHPYLEFYPVDINVVVESSVETNTFLELNVSAIENHCCGSKIIQTYRKMIDLSRDMGKRIIIGSDAHSISEIGKCDSILGVWETLGLQEDDIINNYLDVLKSILNKPL
jgi:putative hydrolase